MIYDFRVYMRQPLRWVDQSRHDNVNAFRERSGRKYPIGCLGRDVELQFLHYESQSEAAEKWNRRLERINKDDSRLFFKFCDRDGCTLEQLKSFDESPIANKVCFVSQECELKSSILIPQAQGGQVPDGLVLSQVSPAYFDSAGWINGTNRRPRWWLPFRCA